MLVTLITGHVQLMLYYSSVLDYSSVLEEDSYRELHVLTMNVVHTLRLWHDRELLIRLRLLEGKYYTSYGEYGFMVDGR